MCHALACGRDGLQDWGVELDRRSAWRRCHCPNCAREVEPAHVQTGSPGGVRLCACVRAKHNAPGPPSASAAKPSSSASSASARRRLEPPPSSSRPALPACATKAPASQLMRNGIHTCTSHVTRARHTSHVHSTCSGSMTRLRARATGHGQTRPQAQPYNRASRQPREDCTTALPPGTYVLKGSGS